MYVHVMGFKWQTQRSFALQFWVDWSGVIDSSIPETAAQKLPPPLAFAPPNKQHPKSQNISVSLSKTQAISQ